MRTSAEYKFHPPTPQNFSSIVSSISSKLPNCWGFLHLPTLYSTSYLSKFYFIFKSHFHTPSSYPLEYWWFCWLSVIGQYSFNSCRPVAGIFYATFWLACHCTLLFNQKMSLLSWFEWFWTPCNTEILPWQWMLSLWDLTLNLNIVYPPNAHLASMFGAKTLQKCHFAKLILLRKRLDGLSLSAPKTSTYVIFSSHFLQTTGFRFIWNPIGLSKVLEYSKTRIRSLFSDFLFQILNDIPQMLS